MFFKTFMKVLAQQKDMMATFMAKWSNQHPGQSGHIHISLRDRADDTPAFFDDSEPFNMSRTMRQFVAGCRKYMPEVFAMVAPTVNSYARFAPDSLAPINATWGIENRTCALRVITGSPRIQRLEYRTAGADANPYLALAAVLASGLQGIEEGLELDRPVTGNAYHHATHRDLELPKSLGAAARLMSHSEMANMAFGEEFVEHYAQTRAQEDLRYRRAITDWELERYFEII